MSYQFGLSLFACCQDSCLPKVISLTLASSPVTPTTCLMDTLLRKLCLVSLSNGDSVKTLSCFSRVVAITTTTAITITATGFPEAWRAVPPSQLVEPEQLRPDLPSKAVRSRHQGKGNERTHDTWVLVAENTRWGSVTSIIFFARVHDPQKHNVDVNTRVSRSLP